MHEILSINKSLVFFLSEIFLSLTLLIPKGLKSFVLSQPPLKCYDLSLALLVPTLSFLNSGNRGWRVPLVFRSAAPRPWA